MYIHMTCIYEITVNMCYGRMLNKNQFFLIIIHNWKFHIKAAGRY